MSATILQGLLVFLGASIFLTLIVVAACNGSGRESRREDAADAAHGVPSRWDEVY